MSQSLVPANTGLQIRKVYEEHRDRILQELSSRVEAQNDALTALGAAYDQVTWAAKTVSAGGVTASHEVLLSDVFRAMAGHLVKTSTENSSVPTAPSLPLMLELWPYIDPGVLVKPTTAASPTEYPSRQLLEIPEGFCIHVAGREGSLEDALVFSLRQHVPSEMVPTTVHLGYMLDTIRFRHPELPTRPRHTGSGFIYYAADEAGVVLNVFGFNLALLLRFDPDGLPEKISLFIPEMLDLSRPTIVLFSAPEAGLWFPANVPALSQLPSAIPQRMVPVSYEFAEVTHNGVPHRASTVDPIPVSAALPQSFVPPHSRVKNSVSQPANLLSSPPSAPPTLPAAPVSTAPSSTRAPEGVDRPFRMRGHNQQAAILAGQPNAPFYAEHLTSTIQIKEANLNILGSNEHTATIEPDPLGRINMRIFAMDDDTGAITSAWDKDIAALLAKCCPYSLTGLKPCKKVNCSYMHICKQWNDKNCDHLCHEHDGLVHLTQTCMHKPAFAKNPTTQRPCTRGDQDCAFGHDHWEIRMHRSELGSAEGTEFREATFAAVALRKALRSLPRNQRHISSLREKLECHERFTVIEYV